MGGVWVMGNGNGVRGAVMGYRGNGVMVVMVVMGNGVRGNGGNGYWQSL